MNPCELNLLITAISNHLYSTLSKEEFACLNVFISELSKSMFSMVVLDDVCRKKETIKEAAKEIVEEYL